VIRCASKDVLELAVLVVATATKKQLVAQLAQFAFVDLEVRRSLARTTQVNLLT
jgi:hypothetical protein